MNVVAILAMKGGGGKTTLAISLAVAAHLDGDRTVIIDLDPQATATNWFDRRDPKAGGPAVVSAQPARLAHVLHAAEEGGADLALIDTPPRLDTTALSAIKAATIILLPCRPAIFDLDTMAATRDLVRVAGSQAPVVAIINGVHASGSEPAQAAKVLKQLGLTVCPITLGSRKAVTHAAALGQSAQEFDPTGKAAHELLGVYRYVRRLLERVKT